MGSRLAIEADRAAVVETITLAFHDDPLWSWAFPDPGRRKEQYRSWWALFVDAAIEQRALWVDDGDDDDGVAAAAAVWVPPGGYEIRESDEALIEPLLRDSLGDAQADRVLALLDLFEEHHPHAPCHYLSLLATHPEHRGRGLGMRLLSDCLVRTDALGEPAVLESSNPANDDRYARVGFDHIDRFRAPGDGPPVAVMWRDPPAGAG